MSTNASFNDVLKRYMPYSLLMESMKRRNYFWTKVKKVENWGGGVMEVPFEGAEASSLSLGALTASNDIAEHAEIMGTISTQPELWGAMKFNEKDLDRHSGDMERSYLEISPAKVKQFTERMGERVSIMLLGDGSIAKATADGDASGNLTLDHPERLAIGEKCSIDDGNSSPVDGYVRSINMETKVVTFYDARTGGAVVNLSGYTVAQNAKVYIPNGTTANFTTLTNQLLSSANGGASSLFGQTKTAYPFLQAQQHDGSSLSSTNILDGVYDFFFDTVSLGKGNPTEMLMSMKHFKNCAKALETKREFVTTDKSAGYGFRSINLVGNEGEMKITGLRDMSDEFMHILDWDGIQFHGDKFFDRKRHLNGDEYFLIRNTTGYEYIVDIKFYGDLVVHNPSHQGIVHGIDY